MSPHPLRPVAVVLTTLLLGLLHASGASAFCGFYVAKADTSLFNEASQVVLVRDEERTVLTMVNDFQGELTEFAIVVPVPTFLEREQIHVGDKAVVDHLDAYTSPRLVEYFDGDPCRPARILERMMAAPQSAAAVGDARERAEALGVTIEASYTVGEYDILILSAQQSDGLETWLVENGYKLPAGASEVLGSYLKQGMRFFVAKVNLEEQAKTGFTSLRPLQMAYESPRFMLPIRLGTLNAQGKQELFIYTLTREGRVETTNYRTVKLPTGMDIPRYVKGEFGDFYRAMFTEQTNRENGQAVFLEYAWDMNWCDPCAADPLSNEELRQLGVFWLGDGSPGQPGQPGLRAPSAAKEVFVTRLHVRYDAERFPDDLRFQQTKDRSNFQGRYVLRHPFEGNAECKAAEEYRASLPKRFEGEAQALANLTGWDLQTIRDKMKIETPAPQDPKPWWQGVWGEN